MQIQSVAILGAGAVGAYIVWGLSHRCDIRLSLVAEGERNRRLKAEGMRINGKAYFPEVLTPDEARGADLLIVALKNGDLQGALDTIAAVATEKTVVMSLLNGVESEDIIASRIPPTQIIHSLIKIASHKSADGFHFNAEGTIGIIFGEKHPPCDTERVRALSALFENTGIHCRATEHIEAEIWCKFHRNLCRNLVQAIIGAGVGCYEDSPHVQALVKGLSDEVLAVAAAKGIDLSAAAASSKRSGATTKATRLSTLQDLDAHRRTEIDFFSGAVMKMGRELGIPTPFNDYTYHTIKALEEKNAGLFNYSD